MTKKVQNLTNRQVILRLNSGKSLFIGPRAVSGEILEGLVSKNAKVDKLLKRGVIALQDVKAAEKSKSKPLQAQEEKVPVVAGKAETDEKSKKSKGGK
jgi:hypothetical protein